MTIPYRIGLKTYHTQMHFEHSIRKRFTKVCKCLQIQKLILPLEKKQLAEQYCSMQLFVQIVISLRTTHRRISNREERIFLSSIQKAYKSNSKMINQMYQYPILHKFIQNHIMKATRMSYFSIFFVEFCTTFIHHFCSILHISSKR